MQLHESVGSVESGARSADHRATELAREALADNGQDFNAALLEWRERVETEPDLILAVVGEIAWRDAATRFMRRLVLEPHGRKMSQVQHITKAAMPLEGAVAKRERATRVELGILGTVTINGKQLAFCTKAEVDAEQKRSVSRATFLAKIVAALPSDDAVVKDFVTPQAAKKWSAVSE